MHGFYIKDPTPIECNGQKILVMGCRYLQKNGSCKHYLLRPKVCRSWPVIQTFTTPRLLKGCGYQAELRASYAKKYPSLAKELSDTPS